MNKNKFGTFYGVFIPNVTFMFGVILFLRLGLIASHAGLVTSMAVLMLSLFVMLITSASTSAIATNMDVGSGGVYYLVTRTLGIEVGGALGIALFISQILSISLTISAFAYTVIDIYPSLSLRGVETVTMLAIALIASFSAKLALRLQGIIFVVLVLSVASIFFGSSSINDVPASAEPFYEGGKLPFWAAFAILYPALTGIEAGMALSGNLKNPSRSLMLGNATSLVFVAFVYGALMAYAYFFIPLELLMSDPFAFKEHATFGWMVTFGICAATLSSALGGILGAPRILQSMAEDGVVSSFFSKTVGKYNEPIFSLLLTVLIAYTILMTTTIDQIIPILAMICLISYCLLNLIAGFSSIINAPSWRPSFKISPIVSIFGAFLILLIMFMLSVAWTLVAIGIVFGIYFILKRRNIDTTFEDVRRSFYFFISRIYLYRLSSSASHASTWHPQLLVFLTSPAANTNLVTLSSFITRQSGILNFGVIVPDDWETIDRIRSTKEALSSYFQKENVPCIVEVQAAPNALAGYVNYIKSLGLGPIQPNTIVLPRDYTEENDSQIIACSDACYLAKKNLLIFNDTNNAKEYNLIPKIRKKQKKIQLYWNPLAKDSFDLLVSFATSLHDDPFWQNSDVLLKAAVPTTEAVSNLKSYLDEFIAESRLKMETEVICMEGIEPDDSSYISQGSQDANVIFVPLAPKSEELSDQEYLSYIKSFEQNFVAEAIYVFVVSYDFIEHREIYNYPDSVTQNTNI